MKQVYCLQIRLRDSDPWSGPEYFKTRFARDKAEAEARTLGGIRTWTFTEKKTHEEIEKLFEL